MNQRNPFEYYSHMSTAGQKELAGSTYVAKDQMPNMRRIEKILGAFDAHFYRREDGSLGIEIPNLNQEVNAFSKALAAIIASSTKTQAEYHQQYFGSIFDQLSTESPLFTRLVASRSARDETTGTHIQNVAHLASEAVFESVKNQQTLIIRHRLTTLFHDHGKALLAQSDTLDENGKPTYRIKAPDIAHFHAILSGLILDELLWQIRNEDEFRFLQLSESIHRYAITHTAFDHHVFEQRAKGIITNEEVHAAVHRFDVNKIRGGQQGNEDRVGRRQESDAEYAFDSVHAERILQLMALAIADVGSGGKVLFIVEIVACLKETIELSRRLIPENSANALDTLLASTFSRLLIDLQKSIEEIEKRENGVVTITSKPSELSLVQQVIETFEQRYASEKPEVVDRLHWLIGSTIHKLLEQIHTRAVARLEASTADVNDFMRRLYLELVNLVRTISDDIFTKVHQLYISHPQSTLLQLTPAERSDQGS